MKVLLISIIQIKDLEVDIVQYLFKLPNVCRPDISGPNNPTTPTKFKLSLLTPNPSTNEINLLYNINNTGTLRISGQHPATVHSYGEVLNIETFIGQEQLNTLDISEWRNGLNTLIIQFEDEVSTINFIKI